MPISNLPSELIYAIIERNSTDKKTLVSCSLVSKEFHEGARPPLFYSIKAKASSDEKTNAAPPFDEEAIRGIQHLVHELTIDNADSQIPSSTFKIYAEFTNVRSLRVSGLHWGDGQSEYAKVVSKLLPNLKELYIKSSSLGSALLLDKFLEEAPHLTSIGLDLVTFEETEASQKDLKKYLKADDGQHTPRELDFILEPEASGDENFVGKNAILGDILKRRNITLRSLKLYDNWGPHSVDRWGLEWSWIQQTETLFLGTYNKQPEESSRVSLKDAKNLRVIGFTGFLMDQFANNLDNFYQFSDGIESILYFLQSASSTKLETVFLEILGPFDWERRDHWKEQVKTISDYLISTNLKVVLHFPRLSEMARVLPTGTDKSTPEVEIGTAYARAWFPELYEAGRLKYSVDGDEVDVAYIPNQNTLAKF